MRNSFVLALSTLIGTIIGAGIFSLPYVVVKSGVIPSVFYFVFFGAVIMLLHLLWGEVCLRTTEKHRIIGYAKKYLGSLGELIAALVLVGVLVGVLLVYLIIGGKFLHLVFSPLFSFSEVQWSLALWAVLSLCIVGGIQLISKLELALNIALFLVIAMVFAFAAPHIQASNLAWFHRDGLFFPFGVLLFALGGWDAIPEITDLFKNRKQKSSLDNVIVWASVITVALFLFFALFVAGVSGSQTTQDTFGGLSHFVAKPVIALGALFGILAIASSFLVLGNYLKNSLYRDFRFSYGTSSAIAVGIPIALFLLGFREFISVIGVVGAVMGGVEGVLMLVIFQRAKKLGDRIPEYHIGVPKIALFGIGFVLVASTFLSFLY